VNSNTLPFWIAGGVLLAGLYGGWKLFVQSSGDDQSLGTIEFGREDAPPLEGFELTRSTGEAFHSDQMKGQVWVASFFFTTCPGSCFKLNTNISLMQQDEALQDVKWVSISVDPANDTPEALTRYAEDFKAHPDRWYFLRGDMKYVRRVGRDLFKLPVEYKQHADYGVVIDRAGQVRGIFNINSQKERERMRKVLAELLAEDLSVVDESDTTEDVKAE
jgi:protein SCO1/2